MRNVDSQGTATRQVTIASLLREIVILAALLHDLGKNTERFQRMLRNLREKDGALSIDGVRHEALSAMVLQALCSKSQESANTPPSPLLASSILEALSDGNNLLERLCIASKAVASQLAQVGKKADLDRTKPSFSINLTCLLPSLNLQSHQPDDNGKVIFTPEASFEKRVSELVDFALLYLVISHHKRLPDPSKDTASASIYLSKAIQRQIRVCIAEAKNSKPVADEENPEYMSMLRDDSLAQDAYTSSPDKLDSNYFSARLTPKFQTSGRGCPLNKEADGQHWRARVSAQAAKVIHLTKALTDECRAALAKVAAGDAGVAIANPSQLSEAFFFCVNNFALPGLVLADHSASKAKRPATCDDHGSAVFANTMNYRPVSEEDESEPDEDIKDGESEALSKADPTANDMADYRGRRPGSERSQIQGGNGEANILCDDLITHLTKTADLAGPIYDALTSTFGEATPRDDVATDALAGVMRALNPVELSDRVVANNAKSGRFLYQNDLSARVREGAERTLRSKVFSFVCIMAGTGSGKTIMNLLALASAQAGGGTNLRVNATHSMRSLSLQTAQKYLCAPIGLEHGSQVSMAGGDLLSKLEWRAASNGRYVGAPHSHKLATADRGVAAFQELLAEPRGTDLSIPVLVSTVDVLATAPSWHIGKKVYDLLRFASADLSLDEVDSYGHEDSVVIANLVLHAGIYGRNVVISSATLPPEVHSALLVAYAKGLTVRGRIFGSLLNRQESEACLSTTLMTVNRIESEQIGIPTSIQAISETCDRLFESVVGSDSTANNCGAKSEFAALKRTEASGTGILGAIWPIRQEVDRRNKREPAQRSQHRNLLSSAFSLHRDNHVLYRFDKKHTTRVSVGAVRLNRAASAAAFGLYLYKDCGEDLASIAREYGMKGRPPLVLALTYHSRFSRVDRLLIESFLEAALVRNAPFSTKEVNPDDPQEPLPGLLANAGGKGMQRAKAAAIAELMWGRDAAADEDCLSSLPLRVIKHHVGQYKKRHNGRAPLDILVIVSASPVIDTGRDLDFDWGTTEPSSARSLVQMAGRVRRHRRHIRRRESAIEKPTVYVLDRPLSCASLGDLSATVEFPANETSAQSGALLFEVLETAGCWSYPGVESSRIFACRSSVDPAHQAAIIGLVEAAESASQTETGRESSRVHSTLERTLNVAASIRETLGLKAPKQDPTSFTYFWSTSGAILGARADESSVFPVDARLTLSRLDEERDGTVTFFERGITAIRMNTRTDRVSSNAAKKGSEHFHGMDLIYGDLTGNSILGTYIANSDVPCRPSSINIRFRRGGPLEREWSAAKDSNGTAFSLQTTSGGTEVSLTYDVVDEAAAGAQIMLPFLAASESPHCGESGGLKWRARVVLKYLQTQFGKKNSDQLEKELVTLTLRETRESSGGRRMTDTHYGPAGIRAQTEAEENEPQASSE